MAVDQLPGRVREFANYLDSLLARLDQGGGWCGVFWQRDPDGMQACLDGREVPPWDVVEALLQDLAAAYGPAAATQEKERGRALHIGALAAFDARPGSRNALGDRLDVMLREQKYAAERQAELGRSLASAATREEADTIRLDLAWARDDHERATARCAELRSRIDELDRRAATGQFRGAQAVQHDQHGNVFRVDDAFREREDAVGSGPRRFPRQRDAQYGGGSADGGQGQYGGPDGTRRDQGRGEPTRGGYGGVEEAGGGYGGPVAPSSDYGHPDTARRDYAGPGAVSPDRTGGPDATNRDFPQPVAEEPTPAPAAKQRKRRRGSARFAGMIEGEASAAPAPGPAAAVPDVPVPAPAAGRTPRGARFAGAAQAAQHSRPTREPLDAEARQATVEAVQTLVRLRSEGRSGEAHALLVEAAYWPAARFPLLAAELQRAGLGADWATLLWEAASLPADRLVGAADALVAAGRTADGEQILRQGVARPAGEIGEAVLALVAEGRSREAHALLDAYVRVRTPEEAARSVEADPQRLVPLLLEAARGVSEERHWDLVHALRVAGFTA